MHVGKNEREGVHVLFDELAFTLLGGGTLRTLRVEASWKRAFVGLFVVRSPSRPPSKPTPIHYLLSEYSRCAFAFAPPHCHG